MNYPVFPYRIFPLGDTAITIDFGNCIDIAVNREVMARFNYLQQHPLPGMVEVVPAYSSITVYYDVMKVRRLTKTDNTAFEIIRQQLEECLDKTVQQQITEDRLIKIPVCYEKEFAPDSQQVATVNNRTVEDIITIHTAKTYKVYMLGFLPGFTYMGELDEKIVMPRKPQPVAIVAGSVGIAGKQTGIYPVTSPGGWQIIGRTPLQLFDPVKEEPTLLRAGDSIQFFPITANEFYEIKNTHPQ